MLYAVYCRYMDVLAISLVFLILYPLLIFAATILPTWWNGFTKGKTDRHIYGQLDRQMDR
jgi:hypothetical protein